MPAPSLAPAVLVLLVLGALAGAIAARRHGVSKSRAREFWSGLLEQVRQAYARSAAEQPLGRCLLRTGYVAADERSARRLARWLDGRLDHTTQVREESDPAFGQYWVVEAAAEVTASPDLPVRWVDVMRDACRNGAQGIGHFSLLALGEPPSDAGGVLTAG